MNATVKLDLDERAQAKKLYSLIVDTSNVFLHNCKHMAIEILRYEDPSYAELAAIMRQVSRIIHALADDFDPMMCQQAHEYCELMEGMGVAIVEDDRVRLRRLVVELERKPGVAL